MGKNKNLTKLQKQINSWHTLTISPSPSWFMTSSVTYFVCLHTDLRVVFFSGSWSLCADKSCKNMHVSRAHSTKIAYVKYLIVISVVLIAREEISSAISPLKCSVDFIWKTSPYFPVSRVTVVDPATIVTPVIVVWKVK